MKYQSTTNLLVKRVMKLAGRTLITTGILSSAIFNLGYTHAETAAGTSPTGLTAQGQVLGQGQERRTTSTAVAASKNGSAQTPVQHSIISVQLEQFKVIKQASGADTFSAVSSVKPGDLIEYRATYNNHDKYPVKGMIATIPVPVGMEFVPQSTRPEKMAVEASTKNGIFSPIPLMHPVKQANGALKSEPIATADYRAIRWNLGQMPGGGTTTVIMRAQVSDISADAPHKAKPDITTTSTSNPASPGTIKSISLKQ